MKIAVLSDIHGNSIALKAVLAEMRACGVEHLFVLGDFVGYYYHPDEVLKLLLEFETTMIRGNHETLLEEAMRDPEKLDELQGRFGSSFKFALERLSKQELEMLFALPEKREVEMGGMTFLLCHGSPWKNDEYIYPDAPEEKLRACADQGVDMVLLGHTHYPLLRTIGSKTLLNPGSVGQPRDAGGAACWAIVDTDTKRVELRRTPFDAEAVANEAHSIDPSNSFLAEVQIRKRS